MLARERLYSMTFTIRLSDEQAAAIQAQAAAEGLSVEAWLQRLAEQHAQLRVFPASQPSRRPVWEVISERMGSLPQDVLDRLPSDAASEHDHYLHGSPKRNQ